jgi:hypothetical protein
VIPGAGSATRRSVSYSDVRTTHGRLIEATFMIRCDQIANEDIRIWENVLVITFGRDIRNWEI